MASQDRKFHYIWLADGTKVLDSETGINYKAYLGSLIYEYGTSQSKFKTEFENGTISFDEMTGQHEVLRYFKDHLGSVRVIMQNGRPAAFNEYEPFGRFEQEYSYNKFQNVTLPAAKNKFMFNGKEEFYNNAKPILNFGARMYDPTIARWNSVDPMAIQYHKVSPYAYCINSPIMYIDPDGRTIYIIDILPDGTEEKIQYYPCMVYSGNNENIRLLVTAMNILYTQSTPGMRHIIQTMVSSAVNYNIYVGGSMPQKDARASGSFYKTSKTNVNIILQEFNSVDSDCIEMLAHELFHCMQNEYGQKLRTILSEVEAYVFGNVQGYLWDQQHDFRDGFGMTHNTGDTNEAGRKYETAMEYLTQYEFSYDMLNQAVTNFKEGAMVNANGLYDTFDVPSSPITHSILPQYYDPIYMNDNQ